jgi:hypothetical protein
MVDKEFVRYIYIMKTNSGPLPHPVRCFFFLTHLREIPTSERRSLLWISLATVAAACLQERIVYTAH